MKITGVITFFSYLLLLNTMLPISLFVTLEILKMCEAWFVQQDYHLYSIERDKSALVSSSSLMEELGQINYLFSDKTGTLTRNEMAMKALAIGSMQFNTVKQTDGSEKFEYNRFFDCMKGVLN